MEISREMAEQMCNLTGKEREEFERKKNNSNALLFSVLNSMRNKNDKTH